MAEPAPVDYEGFAARYGALVRRRQHQGIEQAKLCLQQTVRVGRLLRLEGIAADKLGEIVGLVGRCPRDGPHLVEHGLSAQPGDLIGSLASGQAAPDYPDFHSQPFRRQLDLPL